MAEKEIQIPETKSPDSGYPNQARIEQLEKMRYEAYASGKRKAIDDFAIRLFRKYGHNARKTYLYHILIGSGLKPEDREKDVETLIEEGVIADYDFQEDDSVEKFLTDLDLNNQA